MQIEKVGSRLTALVINRLIPILCYFDNCFHFNRANFVKNWHTISVIRCENMQTVKSAPIGVPK